MEVSLKSVKDFYMSFPFLNKISFIGTGIDYKYFEQVIPVILATKKEKAQFPTDLNIFKGLNIGESELKHCSMLAWFLNPSANHCQQELFFKLFLEKYNIDSLDEFLSGGYFKVSTEDNFSELGRVDITISSINFWFVIEAKISALEQEDQIKRYRRILNTKSCLLNIPRSRCKIFFLTKDGKKPNSGNADFCISWKEIAEILVHFSSECKNMYVSETAKQYANYINTYL